MSTNAMIVSCHDSRAIATTAARTVTMLPTTLVIMDCSVDATPPTSFCRRDWMTPVLVRVKNASSMR